MERQAIVALDCFSRYQSYNAWIVFRPAIEALLIIGKFLDDPLNVALWKNRKAKLGEYKKQFQGKGLISGSIRHSEQLQELLSKINDEFVHVNFDYIQNNYKIEEIETNKLLISSPYMDDGDSHRAFFYSFLNVYRTIILSLADAISTEFNKEIVFGIELEKMYEYLKPRLTDIINKSTDLSLICREYGLWENQPFV